MAGAKLTQVAIPEPLDLVALPIEALRRGFETGVLHPRAVVEAQLDRIDAYNPVINALVDLQPGQALQAADSANAAYRRGHARPLEGVTVAIKESHLFAGHVSTAGSFFHDGSLDRTSAPSVERLLNAGAIVIARSTTPEFTMGASTSSPRYGTTRNPWNPAYSPGGSSGGAAAAVAAGFVTFADGTDHGGSVRTPAACCGVFGYKPSWGRVPLPPSEQDDTCQHYGILTRHLDDLAYCLDIIARPKPAPTLPFGWPEEKFHEVRAPRPPRLGICEDFGLFRLHNEVSAHIAHLYDHLRNAGIDIHRLEIRLPAASLEAYENHCLDLLRRQFAALPNDAQISDYVREYIARAGELDPRRDTAGEFALSRVAVQDAFGQAFKGCDAIVVPSTTCIGIDPEFSIAKSDLGSERGGVWWEEEWQLTWPFNLASHHPVLALPAGLDTATGLPIGIQLAGPSGDDAGLLQTARCLMPYLEGVMQN